jgi:hypothetical protein
MINAFCRSKFILLHYFVVQHPLLQRTRTTQSLLAAFGGRPIDCRAFPSIDVTLPFCKSPPFRGSYQCTSYFMDVSSRSTRVVPPRGRYNTNVVLRSAKHQLLPPADILSLAFVIDWNGTLYLAKKSRAKRDCFHMLARERKSLQVRSLLGCPYPK